MAKKEIKLTQEQMIDGLAARFHEDGQGKVHTEADRKIPRGANQTNKW